MDAHTRQHTYLTSLSAHAADDGHGLLSMWRAYGGPTSGVAIIFNTEIFQHDSTHLGAFSTPVLYGGIDEFSAELRAVVEGIEKSKGVLERVPFPNAAHIMFKALQYSTLSTKHPAFREEREWRIIHSPMEDATAFISTKIATVRGIPQMVCEVPLRDQPGLGMPWLNPDKLIDRVIIGPCNFPHQVAWAFREILREIGVSAPDSRVVIADIPLRQQG